MTVKQRISFRLVLAAAFAAVSAGPIVLLGVFLHAHLADRAARDIAETNLVISASVLGEIEGFLHRPVVSLRHLLKERENDRDVHDPPEILDRALEASEFFDTLLLLDSTGRVRNVGLTPSRAALRGDLIGLDLSREEFFRRAVAGRGLVWSDAARSLITGETALTIGMGLDDDIIAGQFGLGQLDAIARRVEGGHRAGGHAMEVAIVDRNGVLIRSPERGRDLERLNVRNLSIVQAGLAGREGTFEYEDGTRRMLGTVRRIPEMGWLLLVGQDAAIAFAPLARLRLVFAAAVALAAGAALAVSLWLSRWVVRPLETLAGDVRRVAEGDYRPPPAADAYAEFVRLSDDIRAMANEIRRREDSLGMEIAERRRIEEALRENEETLRSLLMSSGEGVFGLDIHGRCTFANPVALQLLGYAAADDLLGRLLHDLIHHHHADVSPHPAHDCPVRAAFTEGRNVHVTDDVFWRADGTSFPVEYRARPVERDGRLAGAVITFSDISERQRAEAALRESEERFRSVTESASDAIIIADAAGTVRFWNQGAAAMFGYAADEMVGRSATVLMPERFFPAHQRGVTRAAAGEEPRQMGRATEAQGRHKDGHEFPIELSVARWRSGGTIFFSAIIRDIAARKKAEEELRLGAKIFETVAEAVMITDADNRVVAVNRTFCDITGYSAEEVMGRDPQFLNSGRHPSAFFKEMWRQIQTDGAWGGEIWNRRKNGEVYPAWLSIATVRDPDGRIVQYVSVFSDITKHKAAEDLIRHQSNHDALTGLPNRTLLMDRLRHAIARAGRGRKPLAVLMIDLDRFKPVNDSFGHTTGDDLLQEVGRRIAGCVRETDTVARLGSDEFAVVLSDLAEPRQADLAARHVMAELGRPFAAGGREVFLTASIGIAVYPTDATEAERLLGNADSAMRDAKRQGRNAYHFFRPELHREAVDRLRLETDLRRALERGELAVFYQPIFELSDGRLAGAEALLRWRHPELGLVGPDRFVPLAEETGLIIPIGEWVIETACAEVRAWTATPGCRDFHIAVNVSSRQFRSAQLVQKVADALLGNGLKPYHLVLEITESMLMEERKEIAATLKGLDELGVRLSVDDFGTGYSSLNYLKRFPVANLKIDRSFVRDVTTDPEDAALVEGVIAIARGLHLDVVGEGIENAEQLAFLRERGVRYGQGYHFKAPVPAEVFAALLPQPA